MLQPKEQGSAKISGHCCCFLKKKLQKCAHLDSKCLCLPTKEVSSSIAGLLGVMESIY